MQIPLVSTRLNVAFILGHAFVVLFIGLLVG